MKPECRPCTLRVAAAIWDACIVWCKEAQTFWRLIETFDEQDKNVTDNCVILFSQGNMPLHICAIHGFTEIAVFLASKQFSMLLHKNNAEQTASDLAILYRRVSIKFVHRNKRDKPCGRTFLALC